MSHEPLDDCGCCDPELPEPTLFNRPGKPALDYRIRTYGSARRAMIAAIPRWRVPEGDNAGTQPLSRLTTRASDDPAIAALDAWAVVTDVLTFYQERIANEGYLRTATERRSVLELARAIGYELAPGVAASTYLAFTVDDAPGAPVRATIPAGTQAQSVPAGSGELPQTFESGDPFVASVAWNRLRPRQSMPQPLDLTVSTLVLAGSAVVIERGDLLLLLEDEQEGSAAGSAARRVLAVTRDRDRDLTTVTLAPAIPRAERGSGGSGVVISEQIKGGAQQVQIGKQTGFGGGATFELRRGALGSADDGAASEALPLDETTVRALVIERDLSESELQLLIATHGWDADDLARHINALAGAASSGGITVHVLRDRLGFFGHNAPNWASLPANQRFGEYTYKDASTYEFVPGAYTSNWDSGGGRTIWSTSQGADYSVADAFLERLPDGLEGDSWAVIVGRVGSGDRFEAFRVEAVEEHSLADYGLTGKSAGLSMRYADGSALEPRGAQRAAFGVRSARGFVRSEPLAAAPIPLIDPIPAGSREIVLDRMVIGLKPGQPVAIRGEQADAEGVTRDEIHTLKEIRHAGGLTTLKLERALAWGYTRKSLEINANVVAATHGELVPGEVLGSGDGAVPYQQFTLKKPPLTHLSAPTAAGAASTLEVRVNELLWEQLPSLYGIAADRRAYLLRIDDDGAAHVVFGDGIQGARLPTGQENVVARYRSGIGLAGEVGARSITLLKTRPFGVREVTNPLPASGAADPETLDDARDNAPLRVLTLDRIVSLRDFENFARAYAGIGKAQAVSLWDGEHALVHLTVADSNGGEVAPGSELHGNLLGAIERARDPLRPLRLASYEPIFFELAARILVDPVYLYVNVERDVRAALLAAYSFERRAFAQPVSAAEVMTLIQDVPGVVAVDLDRLYRVDESGTRLGPELATVIPARRARAAPGGGFRPAQLLRLTDLGIHLTEMFE